MYHIYIRDSNFNRIGEVTNYSKLELIPRFNAVGSFTLDLPTDSFAARELIKPKYGIIVKKDGKELFSGTVRSRKRAFSATDDTLTLIGKDDMEFLARMITYPDINGNFNLQDFDVRTGNAETIMRQYVDINCGQDAMDGRRILTSSIDTGLGSTVTGRARFDNLLDLLNSLALQGGGLGFNVVQVGNSLQFQVYQPADKTGTVIFSPLLGNVLSFDYTSNDPESNFVIVGGGGEGTDRILLTKSDNDSIEKFGRIETFVDQRNTTDTDELNKSLDEELTNKAEKVSLTFTPIDTSQLSFGHDYGLGDKVSMVITQPNETVEIETLYYFISFYQADSVQSERVKKIQEKLDVFQDIVREVNITIDSSGEVINPTIGTQDSLSKFVPKIFDDMKKMKRKISNLERV